MTSLLCSSTTQQQLSKCNDKLSVCDTEKEKLLTKIVSMENKCSKLRDYIRKLTSKCEEWEISYEKQSERLEKHDQRHRETRKKASEIARRYQKLVNDVERRKKVRSFVCLASGFCWVFLFWLIVGFTLSF